MTKWIVALLALSPGSAPTAAAQPRPPIIDMHQHALPATFWDDPELETCFDRAEECDLPMGIHLGLGSQHFTPVSRPVHAPAVHKRRESGRPIAGKRP